MWKKIDNYLFYYVWYIFDWYNKERFFNLHKMSSSDEKPTDQTVYSTSCGNLKQHKVPLSSLTKNHGASQSESSINYKRFSKNPLARVSSDNLHIDENMDDIHKLLRRKQSPRPKKSLSQVELPKISR